VTKKKNRRRRRRIVTIDDPTSTPTIQHNRLTLSGSASTVPLDSLPNPDYITTAEVSVAATNSVDSLSSIASDDKEMLELQQRLQEIEEKLRQTQVGHQVEANSEAHPGEAIPDIQTRTGEQSRSSLTHLIQNILSSEDDIDLTHILIPTINAGTTWSETCPPTGAILEQDSQEESMTQEKSSNNEAIEVSDAQQGDSEMVALRSA
jgi:hypothetical protein